MRTILVILALIGLVTVSNVSPAFAIEIQASYLCLVDEEHSKQFIIKELDLVVEYGKRNGNLAANAYTKYLIDTGICTPIPPGLSISATFEEVVKVYDFKPDGEELVLVHTSGSAGQTHYSVWYHKFLKYQLKMNKQINGKQTPFTWEREGQQI